MKIIGCVLLAGTAIAPIVSVASASDKNLVQRSSTTPPTPSGFMARLFGSRSASSADIADSAEEQSMVPNVTYTDPETESDLVLVDFVEGDVEGGPVTTV